MDKLKGVLFCFFKFYMRQATNFKTNQINMVVNCIKIDLKSPNHVR